VHPNSVDLYAGLYGLVPVPESFKLGHGVVISRTYAHLFAPFTMAFSPAAPGKPHPGPWKSAKGGLAIDLSAQLFLPATTRLHQLNRVNTVWWIVALLRLHASTSISVPVISSDSFASIPSIEHEPQLWPMEIHTPRLFPEDPQGRPVNDSELEWLRDNWYEGTALLDNEDFSDAFQAIDSSLWNHTPVLALLAVWGALERLFSPSNTELSFRVSANIAAFLEPTGRARYALFKKIKGLYDSRSKAAHGSGEVDLGPYADTYLIARRALVKMIETRHVPDKKELEANLFGDPVGITLGPSSEQ
jgi:Apea-like HEPN